MDSQGALRFSNGHLLISDKEKMSKEQSVPSVDDGRLI